MQVNRTVRPNRLTLPVIAASFVLVGVMTTMSGVLLPFLSARYSLPASTTAWLFPAQFLSAATGVISSGVLVRRWGFRATLGLGYALLASGAALFAPATWPSVLAGVCVYGMGVGILNPTSNLAAGTLSRRGPEMVNVLNFCWGAGAVAGPMILPALLARSGLRAVTYLMAPLIAAAFAGVVAMAPSGAAGSTQTRSKDGLANAHSLRHHVAALCRHGDHHRRLDAALWRAHTRRETHFKLASR